MNTSLAGLYFGLLIPLNRKTLSQLFRVKRSGGAGLSVIRCSAWMPHQKCAKATGHAAADDKSCQARHVGIVDEGSFTIKSDVDGTEKTIKAGDAYVIMPGHLYTVNGELPLVLYEFESVLDDIIVPQPDEDLDMEAFDGVLNRHEPGVMAKSFATPDEQVHSKGSLFVSNVALFESAKVQQVIGKPGASWARNVKPTLDEHMNCEHTSCTKRHVGFIKSGQLKVKMDFGGEVIIGPEDAFVIEPGHDAEVVGNADMVMYEFVTGL